MLPPRALALLSTTGLLLSCGGLDERPLEGFVTAGFGQFSMSNGFDGWGCKTFALEAGAVEINGDPVPDVHQHWGGLQSVSGGHACGFAGIDVPPGTNDIGDGELVVDHPGGLSRFVGANLFTQLRGLTYSGELNSPGATARAGDVIKLAYIPTTDVVTNLTAVMYGRDGDPAYADVQLTGDGIAVTIPESSIQGGVRLQIELEATIPTVSCEGFPACEVQTRAFELVEFDIEEPDASPAAP